MIVGRSLDQEIKACRGNDGEGGSNELLVNALYQAVDPAKRTGSGLGWDSWEMRGKGG